MRKWIKSTDGLPEYGVVVLGWLDGSEFHSGVNWSRYGYAFMGRIRDESEAVADGWSRRYYDEALKKIGADMATITHWSPLPEPPARS